MADIRRVLFVCLGNLCRSPTAHGVFLSLINARGIAHAFEVESAGTAAYREGKPADSRSHKTAADNGVDLSGLSTRLVKQSDFAHFDLIVAMDNSNLSDLAEQCPEPHLHKLCLLLDFSEDEFEEVPDPYYGGQRGFDLVFELVNEACAKLLECIENGTAYQVIERQKQLKAAR